MSRRILLPPSRLALLLAILVGLTKYAAAKINGTNSVPDPELSQIFRQLEYVGTPLAWSPNLGGQNFTTCCLKAINEAVTVVENGSLAFTNSSYSNWIIFNDQTTPLDALKDYNAQGEFPCTGAYNGNPGGAPMVKVPYQWLNDTCPGWQISSKDNLNAWLQPLSGFLIPAVIFCISVPRRRKLELPRVLFSSDQSGVQGYFLAPIGATIALLLVATDTLVWLCICFAFAGPMIVSGLYEARLDNRVIDYVKGKIDERQLTLDMRCRCLMLVLIGNLDLVWNTDNDGYVDGGTHAGNYVPVGSADDEVNQQLLHQRNTSYGADSFDGHRDQSDLGGGYALHDMTGTGAYQGVPANDQSSPLPAAPPSAPSVSPGSPAPVIPHSPVDAAYTTTYHDPQVPPMASEGQFRSTPPQIHNPIWNQTNASNAQGSSGRDGPSPQSDPARAQSVVPPPPPPIGRRPTQSNQPNYGPEYGQVYGQVGPAVPGFSFSRASTGPEQSQQPYPASPDIQTQPVTGFPPPAPTTVPHYQTPSGQYLAPAGLGTPLAGSSVVAAGVVAAGVAFGVSHNTNRELLVNHQNGGPLASPWQHMEEFLYSLRLYPDENSSRKHSPRQNAVKTRLKTMLHCQYSFGSVIGAPVVFFLGGFIFALLQSLDTLGDEDIAEGLAFGQWYMTIPHIAIISGLLLAGNNPNILEGVLAVDDRTYPVDERKFLFLRYGLAYPSCYKVASLWDRGHNKQQWLDTLVKTYSTNAAGVKDKDIQDLKEKTTLVLADWFFLLLLTLLLLGVPYVLAFVTAFFTPEVGLSCRSLTFSIYFCVQVMQIFLWIWAYAGPLPRLETKNNESKERGTTTPGWFGVDGRLDRHGFYKPYSLRWLFDGGPVPRSPSKIIKRIWSDPSRLLSFGFLWNLLYYPFQYFLGLLGIMAAIGGTVMQLMGVYTADICYVTTEYWFLPYSERPMAMISTNSAEMIKSAEGNVVSFIGWWYQRRMRDLFAQQVLRIDDESFERVKDTRKSRITGLAMHDAASNMRHPSSPFIPPPGHRSPSAASRYTAPAAPTPSPNNPSNMNNMRTMSESAVATGYEGPSMYGGRSTNDGPNYGALRYQHSMPVIPTARMSVASVPPWNGMAPDGYVPRSVPLQSSVWNQDTAPAPGLGHQGVASPGMASQQTPVAGTHSSSGPSSSFSGPSGNGAQMGGTGLGVYTPVGSQEPEAGGVTRRPHRQTPSPNEALLEEDEHDR
ncbi:cytochrome mitochondrial [Ophiostoma piceae UAMH 11346]|uniref:Cytochrome mitochondrial n=1 Tax=Ophiostoma piceae (strain UAMH 11346) TaxID=1262450 RepID=S3C5C6_OPHP1|nr:cytochrome mitochondrial [Ophiostoma piceae UAMH 11346]